MKLAARLALAFTLGCAAFGALADPGELRAKYSQVQGQLRNNPFHRPIVIESAEAGDALKGDVYAVLDHSFEAMARGFDKPDDWCAVLVLPFNTRSCQAAGDDRRATLSLRIGRKPDQPIQDAYPLELHLQQVSATNDYFESRLTADQGPAGTHDYRITLQAVPLGKDRTFMHLSYSYGAGGMARMGMQAYLSTAGANKVGFSVAGRDANGQPVFVGGVRGVIERNVMRHYLAIEAQLASLDAPPAQRKDKRLQTWFDSTERYARQLHEMDRSAYLALKRGDGGGNQQAKAAPAPPLTHTAQ